MTEGRSASTSTTSEGAGGVIDIYDSRAADLIATERRRQQDAEGFSRNHDREHGPVVLAKAAACYADAEHTPMQGIRPEDRVPTFWPREKSWWKPKGPLSDLIRAGALYQAALDVASTDGRYETSWADERPEHLAVNLRRVTDRIAALLRDVARHA